jgi:hypothetical protein
MCDTRSTVADELTHKAEGRSVYCILLLSGCTSGCGQLCLQLRKSARCVWGNRQGHSFSPGSQGRGQTDSTREKGMDKNNTKEDGGKESTRDRSK